MTLEFLLPIPTINFEITKEKGNKHEMGIEN